MYCEILIFIFIIFKLWCVEKMKINVKQSSVMILYGIVLWNNILWNLNLYKNLNFLNWNINEISC